MKIVVASSFSDLVSGRPAPAAIRKTNDPISGLMKLHPWCCGELEAGMSEGRFLLSPNQMTKIIDFTAKQPVIKFYSCEAA